MSARLIRWLPLLVLPTLLSAPIAAGAAVVRLLVYSGPITPVASEFLVDGIAAAAEEGAAAVILQLDTPGGLDSSMREIVKAELRSEVPVIVFVGPAGSRAASAGAFIALAAHVAAMAPETNIGSASPVQMGGGIADSTMAAKVTHDAAAYIASIAAEKGRDPAIARAFVEEALNLTAAEAREKGVIEVIAPTAAALLDSLDGRVVTVAGRSHTLATADARIVETRMSGRLKLLKHLADPNVAYILMLLGIYGLFFELSNPGAYAPGILGGICLLLALFAFQALPVDYTGVALILLGVILLILEIKVTSFGALSIGGIAALVLGSLMLFESGEQWARLSMAVLIPSVIVFAGFFLLCVWLAVRAQKRPAATGLGAMVGETGRVVRTDDEGRIKVVCHGEVWDAAATVPLSLDDRIRVTAVRGRLLQVVRLDGPVNERS